MTSPPLFSLLIAQYNNGRFFRDCYNSIISQTYQNWQVIIVDDSSTDDSVAVMKDVIGDDQRFSVVHNTENKGCGYTKRKLVELANGPLCGFLDPDDAITKDALELMVTEHQKNPELSMVYSKVMWCDENLEIQYTAKNKQVVNGDPTYFDLDGHLTAFLTFKKQFYEKTDGIDSYLQRAVDRDLVMKLYESGPAKYLDKALYLYRVHRNGISTNQNQDKAYYWYWVAIIAAAKRRNLNIENLFIKHAMLSRRSMALQKEIDSYNKSFIFKVFRKMGLFKL